MNIEARKLEFIQEFLKLQSDATILKLEQLLLKEKDQSRDVLGEPMSDEELNNRIDLAMEDSKNGRLTEASDLLSEVEKWS